MICASCVAHVERALGKANDALDAHVYLATEHATVEYLPEAAVFSTLAAAGEKWYSFR